MMQQGSIKKIKQNHIGLTSLASGLFCFLADVILYPFDAVSTRLKGNNNKQLNGAFSFLWDSLKKQKWKLYKGVSLSIPHSLLSTGLYVYVYQSLRLKSSQIIDRYHMQSNIKLILPLFISAFSQAICLVLELPFDTVRRRIQMNLQQYQYSSFWEGLREIKEKQGMLRFYKSTKIYFVTRVIYTSIMFESLQLFNHYLGDIPYSIFLNAIAATVISTTIVHPLQVLITRYALVDTTKKTLVFRYMIQRILQRQGISGFYKGYPTQLFIHVFYSLFWIPVFNYMRNSYGIQIPQ